MKSIACINFDDFLGKTKVLASPSVARCKMNELTTVQAESFEKRDQKAVLIEFYTKSRRIKSSTISRCHRVTSSRSSLYVRASRMDIHLCLMLRTITWAHESHGGRDPSKLASICIAPSGASDRRTHGDGGIGQGRAIDAGNPRAIQMTRQTGYVPTYEPRETNNPPRETQFVVE